MSTNRYFESWVACSRLLIAVVIVSASSVSVPIRGDAPASRENLLKRSCDVAEEVSVTESPRSQAGSPVGVLSGADSLNSVWATTIGVGAALLPMPSIHSADHVVTGTVGPPAPYGCFPEYPLVYYGYFPVKSRDYIMNYSRFPSLREDFKDIAEPYDPFAKPGTPIRYAVSKTALYWPNLYISVGPDGIADITSDTLSWDEKGRLLPPSRDLWYDPTNGAVSRGDIFLMEPPNEKEKDWPFAWYFASTPGDEPAAAPEPTR